MEWLQRLLARLAPPGRFQEMEAESREWIAQCTSCGQERSIWQLGGVRWRASGEPRKWFGCPTCKGRRWHHIYRKQPAQV